VFAGLLEWIHIVKVVVAIFGVAIVIAHMGTNAEGNGVING
jgi:hypothetical protein